ncbi:adenosine receptor A1-like [Carcharodon carcharias]|uniref:adenosine receptor A1-like n=1 Tax=Carcharodon carcharias TaxID=13397 RepID=UPI001B7E7FE8|nr:adenosine receptor A1-like [Carcharodon carcharias]
MDLFHQKSLSRRTSRPNVTRILFGQQRRDLFKFYPFKRNIPILQPLQGTDCFVPFCVYVSVIPGHSVQMLLGIINFMASLANLSHSQTNCTGASFHINVRYFIVEVLTAIFAVLGNIFICFAVVRSKKLRTTTNYFLVSLAVADILVGAVAIPCALLSDLGLPQCSYYLCVLMLCTLLVLTQASIFGLFAIAVERYIAILKPFRYQVLVTPRNTSLTIVASWVLAMAIGLVPLMGWRKAPVANEGCLFDKVIDESYMVYFNFIGCTLLPLLAMFVIYAKIFLEVKKQIRRIAERHIGISVEEKRRKIVRKELHTAMSLFIVLFCFALSWIPIHILHCIKLYCPSCNIPTSMMLTMVILSHVNSVINPIIYVFRIKTFWEAFKDVFSCIPTVLRKHSNLDFIGMTKVESPGSRSNALPGM